MVFFQSVILVYMCHSCDAAQPKDISVLPGNRQHIQAFIFTGSSTMVAYLMLGANTKNKSFLFLLLFLQTIIFPLNMYVGI